MPPLQVDAVGGTATLNGSLLPTTTEAWMRTLERPNLAFTVVLANDTWDPGIGTVDGPASRDLVTALSSAQSEPLGWNAVVRPGV